MVRVLVLVFFFLSGACGLLYEVAWIRSAGTVLGNTTHAVGTVVAVFMGGLALGGAWGGRLADRRAGGDLLRLYGLLEGGVAASALLVPLLLRASQPLFAALWSPGGGSGTAVARVVVLSFVLLPPTTLMGATLPVLARFGGDAGRAYAVNTFGAVLGTVAAGFFLVPGWGLRATLWLAAGCNALIAGASIALARREPGSAAEARPFAGGRPPRLPLLIAWLSGFAALAYEIAWTRALVLAVGSTVHAFTLILTAFILGLALGAAAVSRWTKLPARGGAAAFQAGAALLALGLLPALQDLPLRVAAEMAERQGDGSALFSLQVRAAALFVFPPALLLGAVFPLALRMASTGEDRLGRTVGAVYTANTLGSIFGSLAATFLLVPVAGLGGAIRIAAGVNALGAAVALGPRRAWLVLPLLALGLWVPAWDPVVASSGSFMYGAAEVRGAREAGRDLKAYLREESTLIAQYTDSYGLTTVHRQKDGLLTMRVNGKADASSGPSDRVNMLYVAHVPLLSHPAPRRALCIGLGAGFTLAAMAEHPLDHLDCVELSPAVRRAAAHFEESAGPVLRDPRVRLSIGDGRNALVLGRDRYDVIVSQPSNLWVSGMASLFTRDFFLEASARLAPGGVMGQWIHAYWLARDDFQALIRTFFDVFPHGALWEIFPGHDYLLVGSQAPVPPLRPATGLRSFQPYAAALPAAFLAEGRRAFELAGPGPLITDDRCFVEYTAPRSLGRDTRPEILEWLEPLRGASTVLREHRAALARAVARQGSDPVAALASLPAGDWDPRARLFIDQLAERAFDQGIAALRKGDPAAARTAFAAVPPGSPPYRDARINLGELAFQARRLDEARRDFEAAAALDPRSVEALAGIARSHQASRSYLEALRCWDGVLALAPDRAAPRVQKALCLWRLDRIAEAKAECRQALAVDPADRRAKDLLEELEKKP